MDESGGDSGGGTGGDGGLGGLIFGFLGGLGGGAITGGGGGGRMAARGIAQAGQKAAIQAARRSAYLANREMAFQTYETSFAAGEPAILHEDIKVTPETKRLGEKIASLTAAGKLARAQNVTQKLQRLNVKQAPQATLRYVAKYGPNNGPPIAGSADDPRGQLRPNLYGSLLS